MPDRPPRPAPVDAAAPAGPLPAPRPASRPGLPADGTTRPDPPADRSGPGQGLPDTLSDGVPDEPPVAPRARHRPARPSLLPPLRPGLLWPLGALAAVGLVGAGTLRGRPLPDDGQLTTQAFDLVRGGGDLMPLAPGSVGAVHAAVYATVTRAFERHATLAGAGRELMLAVLLVSAVLVWRTTRRLGAGDLAAAVAVLAFGALPWLAPAHAAGGPAALAAGWLLVVAWSLAPGRPSPAAWCAALVAGTLAVLLAPDTLVLVLVALTAAVATGQVRPGWPRARRLTATVVLVLATVGARLAVTRWDPQPADPGRWAATQSGLVAVGVVLLGVGLLTALWRVRLRPVGIALAVTSVLAVLPPSGRLSALLVCLPVAAVLAGALVDGVLAARPDPAAVPRRHRRRRPAWVPAAVVAGALAVALVAGVAALRTAPRSDFGAAAVERLAGWTRDQLPEDGRLSVPPALRAELVHAGVDPARLVTEADLVAAAAPEGPVLRVVSGEPPAGSAPVARLDAADGLPPLTVVAPTPVPPTAEELDLRRTLGEALAANPATLAGDDVRAQLAGGELDPRLMSLLAGIGAASGIGLESLPVVPAEEDRTLRRYAVITSVGGIPIEGDPVQTDRVLTLLQAQRAPYTPDVVRPVDGGLLVGYHYVPDPDAVLTRAAPG